jgi:signal transduction histidine kinase
MVAAFVLALRRLSTAPAVIRRQLLPFLGYGCFAVAVIAIGIGVNHSHISNTVLDTVLLLQLAMIFGLPMAFVLAMTVGAFGRAGEVEEVARGISEASAEPRLLDDLMVRALGDGSARVLWTVEPGRDRMVDSDGAPREIAPDQGWWPIGVERPPLGGLQYDRSLVADTSLVATVAAPLELALDNRRLVVELRSAVQRLDAAAAELRTSRRRIVVAADAERRRIARDLHDGVVQDLAGTSYALAAAADRIDGQAPAVSEALRDGARQTRRSIRQLRSLLVDIYPPDLHRAGLAAALSDLVAPLESRGVQARVDLPPGLRLEPDAEALMFRTAQEALRNVMAHSDAHRVDVSVILENSHAGLTIADDGRGFTPDVAQAARDDGHLGLRVLADMAHDAGGRLDIDSHPGRGTRVCLEVPVA